jgi:5-methylthioadenosine/S-adenosylhomocysteine deaminase
VTTRFLLRGGCVLTLGVRTSNLPRGDVLIEDDRVAEIGTGLRARDAELVDASDAIVMPGFVDSHRHAWRSLFRNLGEMTGGLGSVTAVAGGRYEAEDVYAATLIGLLGAVEAGITTVVDFADLRLDDDALAAALQAHTDAGLRTVFVHVPSGGAERRETLQRLREAAGPTTTVAFGTGDLEAPDLEEAWGAARGSGAWIHVHGGPRSSKPGAIARLAERGLLGRDVTLVHSTELDDADLDAIAGSKASVSLAPSSEMAGGLGIPPIQRLIDRDVKPGLGVDDERIAPGDLFAQMRATISMQHAVVFELKLAGKAGLPKLMTSRDVIRSATIGGARAVGLSDTTGSLEQGKQADVVVLRTDRPNVFPINDPIGAVVWGMDTSNVDWVFAGGRVLMREGELQADVMRARALAIAARERVTAAGPVVRAATGGQ